MLIDSRVNAFFNQTSLILRWSEVYKLQSIDDDNDRLLMIKSCTTQLSVQLFAANVCKNQSETSIYSTRYLIGFRQPLLQTVALIGT